MQANSFGRFCYDLRNQKLELVTRLETYGHEVCISIAKDEERNEDTVFITDDLNSGSSKALKMVYHWDTGRTHARVVGKNSKDAEFENEKRVSEEIKTLSKDEKKGLVEIYRVGKTAIDMKKYDGDVSELAKRGISLNQKISILSNVSLGISTLHDRLNRTHNDIKLNNMFYSEDSSGGFDAVMADVDTAFDLKKLKKKTRFSEEGADFYKAPERRLKNGKTKVIPGRNSKKRLENAKKSDVYSFGLSAFALKHNLDDGWFMYCDPMDLVLSGEDLSNCAGKINDDCIECKTKKIRETLKKSNDPLDSIILSATEDNLKLRPQMKEIHNSIKKLAEPRVLR
jgi:hypothetical protein